MKRQTGFTIIEMLVVATIIAIVVTLAFKRPSDTQTIERQPAVTTDCGR